MSIYSGFATRVQEHAYDNLIVHLIQVLQKRIIKFYVQEEADEVKFHSILVSLYGNMMKMEQNKYLQPKISTTFKQLINLTSSITKIQQQQPKIIKQDIKKIPISSKQSLNFSTDKIQQDLKNLSIHIIPGKIRHQPTHNQQVLSSRGQTNPELSADKKIQKISKIPLPKDNNTKDKNLQKWSAIFDKQPPALEPQQQKKNVQYIIREYVSRGQSRRRHKKQNYFD